MVELSSPNTDWENSWRLARLPGLGREHTSFLFRLLHQILPTQERLHRTKTDVNPVCKAAGCTEVEDLGHCLVICPANQDVGTSLVELLRQHHAGLTTAAALRLEMQVEEHLELPMVWVTAGTLLSIWEQRKISNKVQPHLTRANLEAKINTLRETRMASLASLLDELITSMFEV